MRAEGLDEANGSESRVIRTHHERDVIEGCDSKSEGEIDESIWNENK